MRHIKNKAQLRELMYTGLIEARPINSETTKPAMYHNGNQRIGFVYNDGCYHFGFADFDKPGKKINAYTYLLNGFVFVRSDSVQKSVPVIKMKPVSVTTKAATLQLLDEILTMPAEVPAIVPIDPAPAKTEVLAMEIVNVSLDNIYTDLEAFQGRNESHSQESVNRIVSAYENGNFDIRKFDPIRLWLNPIDLKYYILAGHSRALAFYLISKSDAKFNTIPSIIFQGDTKEAAAKFAIEESNASSTKQCDVSFASIIRSKRLAGMPVKDITTWGRNQYGRNFVKLNNYSYLNPTGQTFELLGQLEASENVDNRAGIERIAEWIGEARKQFPALTHNHENELSKFLMDSAKSKHLRNKQMLLDKLQTIAGGMYFDAEKPLNINRLKQETDIERHYNHELQTVETELCQAKTTLQQKRELYIRSGKQGNELANLLIPFDNQITALSRELIALKNQRGNVIAGIRSQQDLFANAA